MSVNSFHSLNGQPPVFAKHAEERYETRAPVDDPIPILNAYHKSLRVTIEDDCTARVYPEYDLLFVKRGQKVVTELVADYDRLTARHAMWCDHCEKPFRPDLRCTWCGEVVEESSNGSITVTRKGGE